MLEICSTVTPGHKTHKKCLTLKTRIRQEEHHVSRTIAREGGLGDKDMIRGKLLCSWFIMVIKTSYSNSTNLACLK